MNLSQLKERLTSKMKQTISEMKKQNNVVALSGGKDSMATCILMAMLDIPFKTITAEVWWKEDITGENPYHYEFLHNQVENKLQEWGITYDFIKSDITAFQYMTTPIVRSAEHPERIGKLRGFPICGKCGIQRDCKSRPCNLYYKEHQNLDNIITGIAANETNRLDSNSANSKTSILELLDIKEYETYAICNGEKLLSPTYTFSERGGCWFCPNQKIQELELLYREFPHLWDELMTVQRMPNKVTELFNRTQTLYDIEAEIKRGVQMKMFVGNYL